MHTPLDTTHTYLYNENSFWNKKSSVLKMTYQYTSLFLGSLQSCSIVFFIKELQNYKGSESLVTVLFWATIAASITFYSFRIDWTKYFDKNIAKLICKDFIEQDLETLSNNYSKKIHSLVINGFFTEQTKNLILTFFEETFFLSTQRQTDLVIMKKKIYNEQWELFKNQILSKELPYRKVSNSP
ncbi:MAG: hypothetical protein BGO10_07340 [Chlamydia sp. 32-24]|nr:MAG: hypothetical protein BGO10_07340 [Chlamydia sp. 32-24]